MVSQKKSPSSQPYLVNPSDPYHRIIMIIGPMVQWSVSSAEEQRVRRGLRPVSQLSGATASSFPIFVESFSLVKSW